MNIQDELMVGNYLKYYHSFKRVSAMDIFTIGNDPSNYSRIELEPYILDVMGFTYRYYLNGELYNVNLKYNIGISSSNVIQIIINKGVIIPNLKLKYVHQLENYIFANFGERLVFSF